MYGKANRNHKSCLPSQKHGVNSTTVSSLFKVSLFYHCNVYYCNCFESLAINGSHTKLFNITFFFFFSNLVDV